MKPRVTAAMRSELVKARDSTRAVKGGVMVVPGIAPSIEAWEAEAEPHQRALMEWSMTTHGGAQVRNELPEPMEADTERKFQHHTEQLRKQRTLTDEQVAATAYARAIGLIR